MGTTAEKLTYLNTTKAQIKDGINRLGGELTNLDTFREYKEALDDIYDKLPKVTGTGSDLSLTPTLKGGLNILPLGNCEQEVIAAVTGTTVEGSNLTVNDFDTTKEMAITPEGKCEQDGTPTPDNLIDIKVVTGDNEVVVSNVDNTQSQSTTLHLGSNYLAGIGDYKDKIVGTKDNWKVVRKVRKVIYNGTEGWYTPASYQNLHFLEVFGGANAYAVPNALSNYFTNLSSGVPNNDQANSLLNDGQFTFRTGTKDRVYFKGITGNDNFKTWLSSHNTTVYYALSTPIETPITDTTLVSQLNALADAYGYSGTTNIMTLSATNNAEMPVEVHYNFVTPAPSPDRPSEVKVVTGDNSIVIQNKNLVGNIIENSRAWGGGVIQNTNGFSRTNYIRVEENTNYYVQHTMGGNVAYGWWAYDINKNPISVQSLTGDYDVSGILTTPSNAYYVIVNFYNNTIATNPPMLEKSSTASTYIAPQIQFTTLHLGSLELCKIGDYQDVITGSKDNWKVVRKVKKVIYNGSEDWKINGTQLYLDGSGYLRYSDGGRCYCNYFIGSAVDNVIDANLHCWIGNNNFLLIKYTDITTVENFKTWLSTHNLIVYYILATPTEETITDTTLINELNGLQELLSYDGTTNITITSDTLNAQMLVQVSALKGE